MSEPTNVDPYEEPFDQLVARVKNLTGLGSRAASMIAASFNEDDEYPTAAQIVARAKEQGYDVPDKPLAGDEGPEIAPEVSMDAAVVLAEVYENCPRVLMANFPSIGRAPSEIEANEEIMDQLNQLPDEIRALLVKVNLADEQLTVWLRDEANDVDRPIGPIDLRRYKSGEQLHQAINVLLRRLPLVLRADSN